MSLVLRICVLLCLWLAPLGAISPALRVENSDLLAARNWTSADVSVYGFTLGMTRSDAIRVAAKRQLKLREVLMFAPCKGRSCTVLSSRDLPLGIDLTFGADERIQEIELEPGWGAPDSRTADLIARRLPGRTGRLVKHFSQFSLTTLLGPPERIERDHYLLTIGVGIKTFDYPQLGLRIRVTGFAPKGWKATTSTDETGYYWEFLEFDFVFPAHTNQSHNPRR